MIVPGLAIVIGLVVLGVAVWTNARFRDHGRLPMQWWWTGEVTWSAPRLIAVAFVPTLAIGLLSVFVVLSIELKPRAGQEHLVLPILATMGATLVTVQLLHIWLIARTLRRNDR